MEFLDINGLAHYHNIAVKQKLEESNLRTINGQSLVGAGDIEIDAGGDIISSDDNSYGIIVPSTLASIDPTLTISGAAADAKAVGDRLANISTGGGRTGADGYSPIANVVKKGSTATITITDKTGTTTASISDGNTGAAGVSVTNAHINSSGYLIITLSDNTTINAGLAQGSGSGSGGTGPAGVGIQSIAKTSTSGLVDTYTITLTDGNTSTFTVTNGATGPKGDDATFTATVVNEVLILGG